MFSLFKNKKVKFRFSDGVFVADTQPNRPNDNFDDNLLFPDYYGARTFAHSDDEAYYRAYNDIEGKNLYRGQAEQYIHHLSNKAMRSHSSSRSPLCQHLINQQSKKIIVERYDKKKDFYFKENKFSPKPHNFDNQRSNYLVPNEIFPARSMPTTPTNTQRKEDAILYCGEESSSNYKHDSRRQSVPSRVKNFFPISQNQFLEKEFHKNKNNEMLAENFENVTITRNLKKSPNIGIKTFDKNLENNNVTNDFRNHENFKCNPRSRKNFSTVRVSPNNEANYFLEKDEGWFDEENNDSKSVRKLGHYDERTHNRFRDSHLPTGFSSQKHCKRHSMRLAYRNNLNRSELSKKQLISKQVSSDIDYFRSFDSETTKDNNNLPSQLSSEASQDETENPINMNEENPLKDYDDKDIYVTERSEITEKIGNKNVQNKSEHTRRKTIHSSHTKSVSQKVIFFVINPN